MEHVHHLDDLAIFAQLVEAGSLRRGSTALRMPVATLSRRLQKLETALGCKLLQRGGKGFALTEAGREYYDRLKPMLLELSAQLHEIDQRQSQCVGLLRVGMPVNLAVQWLDRFLSGFMKRYPRIDLHLTLSNRTLDQQEAPFDVAIRVGKQTQQSLMVKRLTGTWLVLCSAPAYLSRNDAPTAPDQLNDHDLIVARPLSTWRFRHPQSGAMETLGVSGRFSVDDMELATRMIIDGHGIGLIPHSTVADHLKTGKLVPLLTEWETDQRDFYAVWHESDFMPMRQRVFLDELTQFAATNPPVI
ncbi:LysR family transcriptional regulator [Thalassospira lucentensis]|uniref:LysR family transcriptional regulator n=1 Tax=Thalassospira lucentensis TaxID=168935 RepID=UPI003AA85887